MQYMKTLQKHRHEQPNYREKFHKPKISKVLTTLAERRNAEK